MTSHMKIRISKTLLIILGVVLLSSFIWLRFIRERLPRVIPFDLTLLGFILLLYICSIYIIIILSLLFNYNVSSKIFSTVISYILKPLITLDEAIKTNTIIKPYYERLLVYITGIKDTNFTLYRKIYHLFDTIPRIILVSTLLIDTFYFHCLFLLYKVIIVSLLFLIIRYIKYSLTYAKEEYILELEPMVEYIQSNYEDPDDELAAAGIVLSALTVRRFIDIQTDAIVYDSREYTCYPFGWHNKYRNDFCKLHNLSATQFTSKEIALMRVDFYRIMKLVIPISVHLEEYRVHVEYSKNKYVKIIIFSLYLICWSYILFLSVNSLSIDTFTFLFEIIDKEDPFSGDDL